MYSNLKDYRVNDPNYVFRFSLIVFMGIVASGSVLYWKSKLFLASEFQDFPESRQLQEIKKDNRAKQKLIQNFKNKLIKTQWKVLCPPKAEK